MRFIITYRAVMVSALLLCGLGAQESVAASADAGKTAYVKYGCWQCHGFDGQGSATSNGTVLAKTPMPLDTFTSFVRTTNGAMPPYRESVLSNAELDAIYAYLQSLPQPKAVNDIPLLNDARSR